MLKIHHVFIVLGMLLCSVSSATAQVSIGIGFPNVSIGINLPVYPELDIVPGYPVYYAPQVNANYFFYDGMYWVYQNDNWYASSWYNGPWMFVDPEAVPYFVLRVPVRYYRQPPMYFRGWRSDAPPRWGEHWGSAWQQRRSGWDRWNHRTAPAPAPLPTYQRQYSGNRYPQQVQQQHTLQQQNYRYQPHDPVARKQFQGQAAQSAPVQQAKPQLGRPQQGTPAERGIGQPTIQHATPHPQGAPATPRVQPPQPGRPQVQEHRQQPQPGRPQVQEHKQPPQQETTRRKQQEPKSPDQQQRKDAPSEQKQGQRPGQDRNE